MFLSIRELWSLVYRLCGHYLHINRVSQAHYLGNQISIGKKEIKGRRSRPRQIPADVSTNEHNDVQFLCHCPYSSCFGTSFSNDQSERSSLPRIDEQITAHNSQTVLKRRQLIIIQNNIGLYSESVTIYVGKFFQNFAPPSPSKKHIRNNCSDPCLRHCSAICADTHFSYDRRVSWYSCTRKLTIFFEIRIIL